jgi:hypothetical protein
MYKLETCTAAVRPLPSPARRRRPSLHITYTHYSHTNTYRSEVDRIYDWVPGKEKKNAGVPVVGLLWPRPPGPLLWLGGWEIKKSSEGQQCARRNGGFPFANVDV